MIQLSIILPFYKRVRALEQALKSNHVNFISSADCATEIVLVLDEPSEEIEVLKVVEAYDQISWRVIINRLAHPWRNPARAINVGIRHAEGDYVLVMSPESLHVTDVPGALVKAASKSSASVSVGQICWCPRQVINEKGITEAFKETEPKIYYGSVCALRGAFEDVRGFDESNYTWGCDDDNLRARLELHGLKLKYEWGAKAIHPLEKDEVNHNRIMQKEKTSTERRRFLRPTNIHGNGKDWGRDFDEVLFERKGSPHTCI
jgi:GT2 family glycosyltransferase